jgi:hypothetical protein
VASRKKREEGFFPFLLVDPKREPTTAQGRGIQEEIATALGDPLFPMETLET